MAFSAYATSLRGERLPPDRVIEDGVPFFVPQLSKVKTNVMCQSTNQHLLFCFEKPSGGGAVGSEAALASGSYRKQGNQDLYSAENLRKRQRLLDDTLVVAALARFWDTFPHIRQGLAQSLERHDYVDVFMKFYKALVSPSEFSMAEARRIVERDWERDVGGPAETTSMTRTAFLRALFEVADIWTVGIGADIYASFLNKLYDRVTMKVYDKEKCVWLTVFADIDKIRPFEEPLAHSTDNATNQDVEASASSQSSASLVGATSDASPTPPSIPKQPRPPLLKKKMLSVPSGLGSPTKSSISMLPSAEAMGGSMRRLPDLQPVANEAVRTIQQSQHLGIASRAPSRSPVTSSEATSSRSDGGSTSAPTTLRYVPTSGAAAGEGNNAGSSATAASGPLSSKAAIQSAVSTRLSTSPTRTSQRSASLARRDGGGPGSTTTTGVASGVAAQRKRDDDNEPAQTAINGAAQPEIPPQHVRLAMPSIYLSPEITPAHSSEKAARRRIRESMKLAQRLRRITF